MLGGSHFCLGSYLWIGMLYARNMKFGTVVVHNKSWKNIPISLLFYITLLMSAIFVQKFKICIPFPKSHNFWKKQDFSIMFSDSESRKKGISCGWPPFLLKTKCRGFHNHRTSNVSLINYLKFCFCHYELGHPHSKCCCL